MALRRDMRIASCLELGCRRRVLRFFGAGADIVGPWEKDETGYGLASIGTDVCDVNVQ